jgi:hypothetical protein
LRGDDSPAGAQGPKEGVLRAESRPVLGVGGWIWVEKIRVQASYFGGRVWFSALRVRGSGFGVRGSGFGVRGLAPDLDAPRLCHDDFGRWSACISGSGFRVWG